MALKLDKTAMVKNLVRRTKLAYHLDRAIGEGDFVWDFQYHPKQEDTGWHPSSHCTPSPAELWHHAIDSNGAQDHLADGSAPIQKNRQEGFSSTLYKTFMVGHFWHAYLQWILVNQLDFARPKAIERRGVKGWGSNLVSGQHSGKGKDVHHYRDWHYVTGSADVAPVYLPTYGEFLVDFKTLNSHMFKPNVPPGDTIIKWECQVNIYMDFFDLDRALIVGINKDAPHDFKEWEFERNQPLVDALYGKWRLVSTCIEEGVEPPADEIVSLPIGGPLEV